MSLQRNVKYWRYSLEHPEPLADSYYTADYVIVNKSEVRASINKLRQAITSYHYFRGQSGTKAMKTRNQLINDIFHLLQNKPYIQYSEFVAFWKVLDISFSIFKNFSKKDRGKILRDLLNEYCQRREDLYSQIGYSDTTIQVLYDSGRSRSKGQTGTTKIYDLIYQTIGDKIDLAQISSEDDLGKSNFVFVPTKKLFGKFIETFKLKYKFGKTYPGKIPDVIFKICNHLFIVEAKHIKEGGGKQNDSIVELTQFINQKENFSNIHYLSFMDGIYFNLFNTSTQQKIKAQKEEIGKALSANPNNFFCNTKGFKELLKDLIG